MKEKIRKNLPLLLLLFLSIPAIMPFFHDGFFPIHDDTQVARVYEVAQALKSGQFPVRWVSDLGYGYGYPIFNFYGPLPYYFGGFFSVIGFDALLATKLMFIFGILIAGFTMYFLAKEYFCNWGGFLAAMFYLYAPYHAVQIFVRGAVGEFWAYGLIPLVFLSFRKISEGHKIWVVYGGFFFTLTVLSHNLISIILFCFLSLVVLFFGILNLGFVWKLKIGNWKFGFNLPNTKYLIINIIFGLGLSTFYWLPAILESPLTKVHTLIEGTNNFREHFLCLWQLWQSDWGFGGSAPGCLHDGISFKLGKLPILLATGGLAALSRWFWQIKKEMSSHVASLGQMIFYLFIGLFSLFMLLPLSKPIWEMLPFLSYLQYPWRFLVFLTFAVCFFAGAFTNILNSIFSRISPQFYILNSIFYILIAVLPLIRDPYYFQPQKYLAVTTNDYANEETLKWRTSKISDEYLPKNFQIPQNSTEVCWAKGVCDPNRQKIIAPLLQNNPLRIFANLVSLGFLAITIAYLLKLCYAKT